VISLEQIEIWRIKREGEMDGLFEEVGEITKIHNELYGRAFEAGKIAGRKELEAENARLRGEMSKISAECGRALKLVDKL